MSRDPLLGGKDWLWFIIEPQVAAIAISWWPIPTAAEWPTFFSCTALLLLTSLVPGRSFCGSLLVCKSVRTVLRTPVASPLPHQLLTGYKAGMP